MRVRLHNLSTDLDTPVEKLMPAVCARLACSPRDIASWQLARRAVDARRGRVRLVYSLDIELGPGCFGPLPRQARELGQAAEPFAGLPAVAAPASGLRPIVVGAGPGGLLASYVLARAGRPPLLLERGRPVERRIKDIGRLLRHRELDPESNILFGEGGAGTFSDGKLRTNLKSPWIEDVLRLFVACGAPERILTDARPHIGTNLLWKMLARLRARLEQLGVTICFGTRVDALKVDGACVRVGAQQRSWQTDTLLLAVGHSARDIFALLQQIGAPLERKPFQMGVRVEHPRAQIDAIQYGASLGHAALLDEGAEYRLHADGVTTFCMCPGGMIVPAFSEHGGLCLNGMSLSDRRHPFSNSGVVATVWPKDLPGDDPLEGVRLQREVERAAHRAGGGDGSAPAAGLRAFVRAERSLRLGNSSYRLGLQPADLALVLPVPLLMKIRAGLAAFGTKMPGFLSPEALVLAAEARCSSPVRMVRDRVSRTMPGFPAIYPIGEGAGYAGGIMTAAIDGIKSALAALRVPA